MIATRSHTISTSERMWVFMKTVLPSSRRRRIRSRISLRPIGIEAAHGLVEEDDARGREPAPGRSPHAAAMPFE